jgi:hypothetical protein
MRVAPGWTLGHLIPAWVSPMSGVNQMRGRCRGPMAQYTCPRAGGKQPRPNAAARRGDHSPRQHDPFNFRKLWAWEATFRAGGLEMRTPSAKRERPSNKNQMKDFGEGRLSRILSRSQSFPGFKEAERSGPRPEPPGKFPEAMR